MANTKQAKTAGTITLAELASAMPNAVLAPDWEARGNKWEPIVNITGNPDPRHDPTGVKAVRETLAKFGGDAVAYYPAIMPGHLGLQIQFRKDIGAEPLSFCNEILSEDD